MLDLHTHIRYEMHSGNACKWNIVEDGKDPVEKRLFTIRAELSLYFSPSAILVIVPVLFKC